MQEQNEPGAVITPGATATSAPQPIEVASARVPEQPTAQPQPVPPASPSTQFSPQPVMPSPFASPDSGYSDSSETLHENEATDQGGVFMTWQTQESDELAKQGAWYGVVALVAVALTVVVFFLTGKDIFASVAVFLAVLCFAYLGSHKPKEQQYALAEEGIYVGDKLRLYEEFKNFSEIEENTGPSIVLVPHKRFASPLVLKLTHDTVDEAVDTLAHFLPVEDRKPDAIDQLVRRIRL